MGVDRIREIPLLHLEGDEVLVAVDDGFSQGKSIMGGLGGLPARQKIIPTSVKLIGNQRITDVGGRVADNVYELNGRNYSAGMGHDSTRHEHYHGSDANVVAVHHLLHAQGLAGRTVNLVCGVPISDYFVSGERNKDLIDHKVAALKQPVTPVNDKIEPVVISTVSIYPQGITAWIDHGLADADLDWRNGVNEEGASIGIIDIGGSTTDFSVITFQNKRPAIDHSRSGSIKAGVLDVTAKISDDLLRTKAIHGGDILPIKECERAVREGRVRIQGRMIDVSTFLDQARRDVMQAIMVRVSNAFGRGSDLESILLLGGGAHVFETVMPREDWPHLVTMPDPEMANVRGMLKYAALAHL